MPLPQGTTLAIVGIGKFVSSFCREAEKGGSTLADTDYELTEKQKVEAWRLHVLLEAAYPQPLAERLAGSDADLHQAVELVGSGCSHDTAARILI